MKTVLFQRGGFVPADDDAPNTRLRLSEEKISENIETVAREREHWLKIMADYIYSEDVSLTLMRYLMSIFEEKEMLLISMENRDIKDEPGLMYIEPTDAAKALQHTGRILEEHRKRGDADPGIIGMLEYFMIDFDVVSSG